MASGSRVPGRLHGVTVVWLLCAAGCASAPGVPGELRPRRAVPIVYLEGQPHRPFVELTVGGVVGHFLVDTGAAGHVMSDWFYTAAFPARRPAGRTGYAVDFAGVPIPVTMVAEVPVTWQDGTSERLDFGVGPFSRPAEADGMAGIVSPQALRAALGSGALELDFPGLAVRWWPAMAGDGVDYSVGSGTLVACPAGSRGAIIFTWATAVDGEAVWAMMDSGSPVTAVTPDSEVGRKLFPRSTPAGAGRGTSAAPVEARAASATLMFGGGQWVGTVALMKLPLAECGNQALLGMNLLRHCRVHLGADRGVVRCGG